MGKYLLLFFVLIIQSEIFSQQAGSASINPKPVDRSKNTNWPVYSPTDSTYLLLAEEMPEPIGGIEGIQSKVTYTEDAKLNGIEGKLYVLAKINENGDVVETEIIRSLGHGLD